MRTVVVTGSAGSLGRRVCARLARHPDVVKVVAVDRIATERVGPKVESHEIDLASALSDELAGLIPRGGDLVHLAWLTPGSVTGDEAAAASINRRALRHVLEAAASAGVEELVHLSSATVYGAWPDNKVPLTEDETLRPNPEFAFAVTKAEAERAVSEWADAHPGTRVAVLRPAVTVGAPDQPLYEALGAIRTPGGGDGRRPVQFLHLDDLASAVVLVWERRLQGVYNVAPDAGVPEASARALAGGVARVVVPARIAAPIASVGWRVWRGGVPKEARAYATHPWVVAPDRLRAEGWRPQYTSEEALVATDERLHWDDLPPGQRQNYNLLVAAVAASVVVGGAVAAIRALRSRTER